MTKEYNQSCCTPEFTIELIDKMTIHILEWIKNLKIVDEPSGDEICGRCFESVLLAALTDILARIIVSSSMGKQEKLRALYTQTINALTVCVDDYTKQEATDKSTRRH